ncbi:MAG TPA: S8 family serine peptidase [Saprospiraceae bacterium]|nr:S8 family serine peptidase [Saprospiraceae bacterium]
MKKNLFFASMLMLWSVLLPAQKYDFKIPDIENETAMPTAYDLENGNYAGTLLKIDLFEPQIESMLDGEVWAFIIDTGIDPNHQYLKDNIATQYAKSFVPGESWIDGNSHGTHVAGCAFGYSEHIRLGTAQILAKHNKVHIVPLKGLSNSGMGNYIYVLNAVNYVRQLSPKLPGFKMIMMSLGGSSDYDALESVIKAAREEGIFVSIAAGNSGGTPVQFPGRSEGADAIAATDSQLKRDYYSSYGKEIMFAAPGTGILAPIPGGGTAKKTGTSMAQPTFAGEVALLSSMHPKATANQLEQMIAKNSTDILPEGRDELTGMGAAVFGLWIFSDPTQLPDEPVGWLKEEDPEQPELTRETRTLEFEFRDREIWWKNMSDANLEPIHFDVTVTIETNLYDESIHDKILDGIDWYTTNRALVVADNNGFKDATHYAGGHFLEMLVNREYGINLKVKSITGIDESGRICHVDGADIHRTIFTKALRRLKVGEASMFTF